MIETHSFSMAQTEALLLLFQWGETIVPRENQPVQLVDHIPSHVLMPGNQTLAKLV